LNRKALALIAALCALVFVASALATTTYGPLRTWTTGASAQSGYNSSWSTNNFGTYGAYATTVTFIDNNGYHWHDTSSITSSLNHTYWTDGGVGRSMYCVYRDQFSTTGSCYGS